jgi:hypothetical protein
MLLLLWPRPAAQALLKSPADLLVPLLLLVELCMPSNPDVLS